MVFAAVLAALVVGCGAAWSYDVEYWAGEVNGTNSALCLIDFGSSSYVFGYKWNDGLTPKGIDMVEALDSAGALDAVISDFGFGKFVDGFSYDGNSLIGFGGDENWWHYWISEDGTNWTSPSFGASARTLTDGAWDGWGYGFATPPDLPTVPEPGSLAALALGLGAVFARRRK